MSKRLSGGSYSLATGYRMKLSSIALIVFIVVAGAFFYLNLTGVISDIVYYIVLVGLLVGAIVLTFLFGRISKKRHDSTIH
ncbi:MAG: hypothetical protein ACQCN5_10160 [Candidatus Bathyarchaeia archaeon]|jgi:hypothetical protein